MDTLIAHRLGVSHMAVYLYRKQLGIRSEQVRETRYDTWIRLLEEGRSVEAVASLYEVKPDTILTTLYRTREFSYPEVKERARLAKEEDMRRALGVTVRDLQAQRMQAWVKLGQAGTSAASGDHFLGSLLWGAGLLAASALLPRLIPRRWRR